MENVIYNRVNAAISAAKAMDKMKGCPWCGVEPTYEAYGYYHLGQETREIRCVNVLCKVKPYIIWDQGDEPIDLVETWNERAA